MMSIERTQKLLKEYQELKDKSKDNLTKAEIEKLNKRIDEIRGLVLTGHMKLVRKLINKSIKNIQDREDSEDIYQIGYEELLKLIDIYDESKNATFLYYVSKYLMLRIKDQILVQLNGFSENLATDINRVISVREKINLPIASKDEQQILSDILGFKTKKMSVLLRIERNLDQPTIDLEDESLSPYLVYSSFEEDMIETILRDNNHLEKLLETLTPNQRQAIKLYYGLGHTYEEIAQILNLNNRERVRQIIIEGILSLTTTIKGKYLRSIYGNPINDKHYYQYRSVSILSNEQQLKEFLITTFSKEILEEILRYVKPKTAEVLRLYYGLKDGLKYDLKEICQILNYDINKARNLKNEGTELLMKHLARRIDPNYKGSPLEYLLNYYLNNQNPVKKKKREITCH